MELPRDLGWFSGLLESVVSFCSEFAQDWSTNDMRVTIFKILLGWLVCSLVAIHMAWKYHGATVNDMYYRQAVVQLGKSAEDYTWIGFQYAYYTYLDLEIGHTFDQDLLISLLGSGGQNGGTPDGSSNFTPWEDASGKSMKSHRELQ
ncbi:T-cell leukemia translocation-altered gene protein homolog isoform X1 [Hypanus sabinus]|uniref:T-cell leukemia translocation-altered gene protein homolog isoform X1 n=1 Tax=Hypanus sabinus TaxID=79690 RepID=UPI0028C439D6|nr:T-cell leukemia translocation-altered gene protein homolog isoform X1 [Hypanus sabinus]